MQVFEVTGDFLFNDHNTRGRLNQLNSAVESSRTRMQNMANTFANVGSSLMSFGSTMINSVSKPIIGAVGKSVMAFSDLGEATNVVDVTFGKNSDSVKKWSKTLLDSFGIGQLQATEFSGTMGSIFKSLGMGEKDVMNMSKNVVELSGDFASFKNLSPEESFEKIRSGLLGETEPLKQVGILVDENTTKHFAMQNGLKKNWNELTQSEKVMWRYKSILDQTKDAHGDFARTGDSFANKMRVVKGRISDLGIEIGGMLMPYIQKLLGFVEKGIAWFGKLDPSVKKVIVVFGLLVAAIGPIALALGGIITIVGGVIGVISALSSTVLIVGGVIAALAGPILVVVGGLAALAVKSGFLTAAMNVLKNAFSFIVAVIKGDVGTSVDILVQKFGISEETAKAFGRRLTVLKYYLGQVKQMIVNVATVIGTIFTGDKQKMIDTLVQKFGFSKKEAEAFWKKAQKLKDEIVKLANRIKELAVKVLTKFIEMIRKAATFVYEHRKEIMKVIEAIITFGTQSVKNVTTVVNFVVKLVKAWIDFRNKVKTKIDNIKSYATSMKDKFSGVFSSIKGFAQGVIDKFNAVKNAIGGVIKKITGIKFPKPPSWFKGFAKGVTNFAGGLALVGEEGPEIVELPKGSNVIPNNKIGNYARQVTPIVNNLSTQQAGGTVNYIYLDQFITEQSDAETLYSDFARKIKGIGVVRNG